MSWLRRRGELVVVMNRDERRDRAPARPPRRWPGAGGGFVAPEDGRAGGTWIAVRETGLVLALLNHHPARRLAEIAAHRPDGLPGTPPISRGRLVALLAAEAGVPDAARLRACGLDSFAPFRLLIVGPGTSPRVFTWDGARLSGRQLAPRIGFLTSSSWAPGRVIPARHARFRAFRRAPRTPTTAGLVAFHEQATDPRGTAWAICMSRDDACTVSMTVVEVRPGAVSMRYAPRSVSDAIEPVPRVAPVARRGRRVVHRPLGRSTG